MSGRVFFIPLSFLFIVSFKQHPPEDPVFKSIRSQFDQADRLYNLSDASAVTDSACLVAFRKVIVKLNRYPRSNISDSLLYQSYFKAGVLCEVYNDFPGAKTSYLDAIPFSQNPEQKFRMFIYAGAGYYKLNNFDSASFFLLQAEKNINQMNAPEDRVRLYNSLGVLYYDNGNYLQSKNYFTQALRLIESNNHADALIRYSLRLNIATCFYKLGLYEQALDIYRNCLVYMQVKNPLYMNMGRAYAGLHQYKQALSYFKKVKIEAVPGVLNEMAVTALESGMADSASAWLNQYQSAKKSFATNALDDGVNELYSADLALYRTDPGPALAHLQKALIIFSKNFTTGDIRKNPENFTGSFAYYRLFEVLAKKAKAWEMLYRKNARPEDLRSAYDVYESTISLLSYIERSYETDDAKLLLKKNSGQVYQDALRVCLMLNRLYPDAQWLDAAFLISEKNKASVMGSQIRESNFLRSSGRQDDLAAKERNIKFNIARLNSKTEDRMDAMALQKINDEKSVYETQLVNLRRAMEGDIRFYQFKYSDDFPSIRQLQESMHSGEALISFYNTPEKIELFVLTKSKLIHKELDSGESIRRNIKAWIQILQSAESGKHMQAKYLSGEIYKQFVKPLNNLAGDKEIWIVVPDGLFFQLPIESLQGDEAGGLILEGHAVSYEFSARFMMYDNRRSAIPVNEKPLISFAPFAQKGADLKSEGMDWLNQLPFSAGETASIEGERLTDRQATKEVFLKNLNHYPIVHLATHAMTDPENPSASCIAFFPGSGLRTDDLLYLDEIYALRMDSCRLMVISACETGKGALVRNEGAMSFARAFLYAGCPSTINTLWKADDRTTSEILRSFYIHLEEGYSKPRALQKAKLEFIRNNPVDRNPAYWSHLILTGSPVSLYKKKQPLFWWAVFGISFGTISVIGARKRKKSRRFS
jgi:CHAT domain-containing protein/tetratricopeptide (TPR) repeat protein